VGVLEGVEWKWQNSLAGTHISCARNIAIPLMPKNQSGLRSLPIKCEILDKSV
jgi:hypothetical protein